MEIGTAMDERRAQKRKTKKKKQCRGPRAPDECALTSTAPFPTNLSYERYIIGITATRRQREMNELHRANIKFVPLSNF